MRRLSTFFLVAVIIICTANQTQSQPMLSAPVNGSTWETVNPTLYWWYVPTPYSAGPFNYHVQVSTHATNFASPYLIVDANVSGGGAAYYFISTSLSPGTIYYWRIGVGGNYSSINSFTPYGSSSTTSFTIVATAGPNGSINPSGNVTVSQGSNASFSLVPDAGYVVADVLVDGSSVGAVNSYTFTNVNANHTISASFAASGSYYTITASAGSGGTISPSGVVNVLSGDDQTFTITPQPSYSVYDVFVDGGSVGAVSSYTFNNVNSNHTITASFIYSPSNTYYVDASNPNSGDGSILNPFKNLQEAIDSSVASGVDGNTIYVAAGNYNYFVTVNDNNLTIIGSSGAVVKRFLVTGSRVNISQFTVTNTSNVGAGIIAQNITNLTLSEIKATGNTSWGGYFVGIDTLIVNNSTFSMNGSDSGPIAFYGGVYLNDATNIEFNNVTANSNTRDGFAFSLISNAVFNNLVAKQNTRYGLAFDESEDVSFVDGVFSKNLLDGIHIHPHYEADFNAIDSILTLSFTGAFAVDSNSRYGLVLMTDITSPTAVPASATNATYIKSPVFNGSFSFLNNGSGGLWLVGNVISPSFHGLNVYGNGTNHGVLITGWGSVAGGYASPTGVVINNSFFDGFTGGGAGPATDDYAITLANGTGYESGNDVDAQNNTFFGATLGDINDMIWDVNDNASLGEVIFTGWNDGSPTINIENVTSFNGSSVSVPVHFTVGSPVSYYTLSGKIAYDSTKLQLTSIDVGTGTWINTVGWSFPYSVSNIGVVKIISFTTAGLSPITGSGVLFKLNFNIVAASAGSATIDASSYVADWLANAVAPPFTINNGIVTYTVPVVPSTLRGDANMDYSVSILDANTVMNHLNTPFLSGQSATNADANLDLSISAVDISYILFYVANGYWPIFLPNGSISGAGDLEFANVNYNDDGNLEIDMRINNGTKVRAMEVLMSYDSESINYKTFSQKLLKDGVIVSAKELSPGNALFVFATGDEIDGAINPGKITLAFKENGAKPGSKVETFYRINDAQFKVGPSLSFGVTNSDEEDSQIPTKFEVMQNYPNPFNPTTTIRYSIPKASFVTVKIYNMLGQEIRTLFSGERSAGTYSLNWNGENNYGLKVTSGAYIYRVVAEGFIETKKMMLLK